MITTFNFSRILLFIRKYCFENKKLSLFSPLTLLIFIAIVFTLFLTVSGETGYPEEFLNDSGVFKNRMENGVSKPVTETMYKTIVTNGDAIRSVLQ